MTKLKTLKENIKLDRIGKKLREIPEEERTLKTLKEIYKEGLEDDCGEFININRLRAEEVKDLIAIKQGVFMGKTIADYIKWKFNITEEELTK